MATSANTPRRPRSGSFVPLVLGCAVALTLLGSSGCATVNKAIGKPNPPKQSDPILGEVHPQNTQPYGPTPPTEKKPATDTSNKTSAATPPLDPLLGPSPTSNAYLASTTKPLPGATTLAIADGKPAPFQLTGSAEPLVKPIPKDSTLPPPPPPPPAKTGDPAFSNSSWVAAPVTSTSNSSGVSFNSAPTNFVDPTFAPLTSRGITQHRVDPQPDGSTRLIAIAPQPSGTFRTYDVTARDIPSAVQAVVQQIDRP